MTFKTFSLVFLDVTPKHVLILALVNFRMSSSLSLDLSSAGCSTPPDLEKIKHLEAKLVRKTIPVGLFFPNSYSYLAHKDP